MTWKPELLSPAGSLDKLKVAVSYGADAVYLAGQKFGLRTAAENFTPDELEEGIAFAHARKVKVFVVLNGFLHDADLAELPEFLNLITGLKADAVIVSDLGVIRTVAGHSKIPIHLSTQASCLNRYAAQSWKNMGVQRLILGREVSIEDAGRIRQMTGLEVELFIHGSMCMAFSGNCTISNFTQGRDSNRGGCAQSCRFKYSLDVSKNHKATKAINDTAFMSSKDLNGIELLAAFFAHKIDSLKIEGRMRSPLYAAMTSRVYREAIDTYAQTHSLPPSKIALWQEEFERLPHRTYTEGSLRSPAGRESIIDHPDNAPGSEPIFVGLVRKVIPNNYALVEVRTGFDAGTRLEFLTRSGAHLKVEGELMGALGEPIDRARPNTLIRLRYQQGIETGLLLRRQP